MSATTDCNPSGSDQTHAAERLVARLTAVLPDAAVVQVRLSGPWTPWPHLRLTARDGDGHAVGVARAKALTIARWIIRSFPDAGWAEAGGHILDLRTAQLHKVEPR